MGRYADIVAGMLGQGVAYSGDSDELDLVLGDDDDDELAELFAGDGDDFDDLEELFAGDDDDDELEELAGLIDIIAGRRPRKRRKAKRKRRSKASALKNILRQRLAQRGAMVRQMPPSKAREWQLNFDSETTVVGGGSRNIISQPQVVFRGERLVVPSDIAGQFLIVDIIIGQKSQFAATGAAPTRTYQENAVGVRLALDTAQISQNVVLRVENIGSTDQRFVASMIGTIIE